MKKNLDFMGYVIDNNALVLSETQPNLKYVKIAGVTLTTKVTEEITLVENAKRCTLDLECME